MNRPLKRINYLIKTMHSTILTN